MIKSGKRGIQALLGIRYLFVELREAVLAGGYLLIVKARVARILQGSHVK